MQTPQPKETILKISPYKPGLSKTGNNQKVIKLSSNENPFGSSQKAIFAYTNCSNILHRYPEANLLNQEIGKTYGLDPNKIVCGAGSDEIISLICLAYSGVGDDVLYSQYGFLMYPISSMTVGANPIPVAEQNLKTDIEALIKAVTPKTKIVFLANPNNPTGSYLTKSEILDLRKRLRPDILLVLDGAYCEYAFVDDYSDGIDVVDLGHNTVVTRTFSKIYGLANLRVGWAYCPTEIADILNRVRGPFNVSGPAIFTAIAALSDQDFIIKAKKHNQEWLNWMDKQLRNLGLQTHPSIANFILATFNDPKKNASDANLFLLERGIITRPVANYGLPNSIRFTIGLEEDNKAVINALKDFLIK